MTEKFLPPILETTRLILRPLTLGDKPAIYKWASDPRVAKYMRYSIYTSVDDANFWLENLYLTPGELDYGFVLKQTSELIGSGGLIYHSDDNSWGVGYNLRYDMWNKGFATEACKKIIEYARESCHGDKIIGTFAVDNLASGRVIEKLGMSYSCESQYSKFDGSQTFKSKTYEMKF